MKKVCVVTGGGSGIGFAAAKEAAKKGYYVMIVGRNEKKLAGAVEELRKDGAKQKRIAVTFQTGNTALHWQGMRQNVGQ